MMIPSGDTTLAPDPELPATNLLRDYPEDLEADPAALRDFLSHAKGTNEIFILVAKVQQWPICYIQGPSASLHKRSVLPYR